MELIIIVLFCSVSTLYHTHTHTHRLGTRQTLAEPGEEPWAGYVDSGSRDTIGPAGILVEGPVTDQLCRTQQPFLSGELTVTGEYVRRYVQGAGHYWEMHPFG